MLFEPGSLRASLELPSYSSPCGSPKKRPAGAGHASAAEAAAIAVLLLAACAVVGAQLAAARTQLRALNARAAALEARLLDEKNARRHVEAMLDTSRVAHTSDRQELELQLRARRDEAHSLRAQLLQAEADLVRARGDIDANNKLADRLEQTLDAENDDENRREDAWVEDQAKWEELEEKMKAEIESLEVELKALKSAPAHAHHDFAMPRHMGHAPVLDTHNAQAHHHFQPHGEVPVFHHPQELQY